jgi:hypothetical protein
MGGDKAFNVKLDSLFKAPSDSVLVGGYGFKIHEINEMVLKRWVNMPAGMNPVFR